MNKPENPAVEFIDKIIKLIKVEVSETTYYPPDLKSAKMIFCGIDLKKIREQLLFLEEMAIHHLNYNRG